MMFVPFDAAGQQIGSLTLTMVVQRLPGSAESIERDLSAALSARGRS